LSLSAFKYPASGMKEALAKNIYTVPFYHFKIKKTVENKYLHREVSVLFFKLTFDLIYYFYFLN